MTPAGEVLRQMRRLPLAEVDVIAPGTSLILTPHPDDETLGCGGLIIECCARGRPPLIVAVTDGAGSHPGSTEYPPERLRALRADELRSAAEVLGVAHDRVHFLNLPDTRAPQQGREFDRAVQAVAALIRDRALNNILATWAHDPHSDHQATARIAQAAADMTGVRLLSYPIWGWLLPPDMRLPISRVSGFRLAVGRVRERKLQALAAHASQYSGLIVDDPHGFRLPKDLLAIAAREYEVFLEA